MFAAIVLSISVPIVVAVAYFAVRGRLPQVAADVRGIALQTVIIMVVLLAIAGAVAGVLLARGGEAVSEVERQDVRRSASEFPNKALCEEAGYNWTVSAGVTGIATRTSGDCA